jgi:hypothetical protein
MQTVTVRLSTLAARRLDWQAALYAGEVVKVRIEDPRDTGLFADCAPADAYLAVVAASGDLWAAAGPFAEVTATVGVGEAAVTTVVAWEATLDLRGTDLLAAMATLAPGSRVWAWAGLLDDADVPSLVGTGEAVVAANPLAQGGGIVPTPPEDVVEQSDFSGIAPPTTNTNTLALLRAKVAEILAALKGL